MMEPDRSTLTTATLAGLVGLVAAATILAAATLVDLIRAGM